jgi:ferredoxin
VQDIEERRVAGLLVTIDRLLCVGFGDCMEPSSAPFELDPQGIATFTNAVEEVSRALILEACRACPVDALTVLDEEGRQLVP